MFGLVARLLLVLAVLLGLLLALPRTLPATLAWVYPEAAFWHDARDREVLLAIDDGPDPATTPQILDALDAAEAKAMFFVLGEKAVEHPELILEIAARGHKVGVHMFRDEITALRSPEDIATDLTHTVNAIPESVPLTWLRPGYGLPSRALLQAAEDADLRVVVGDIAPLDVWGLPPGFYRRYLELVTQPGALLTFHDRPDVGAHTAEILPDTIAALRDKGYRILPWSQFRPAP